MTGPAAGVRISLQSACRPLNSLRRVPCRPQKLKACGEGGERRTLLRCPWSPSCPLWRLAWQPFVGRSRPPHTLGPHCRALYCLYESQAGLPLTTSDNKEVWPCWRCYAKGKWFLWTLEQARKVQPWFLMICFELREKSKKNQKGETTSNVQPSFNFCLLLFFKSRLPSH